MREAYEHPERDNLQGFSTAFPVDTLGYHSRNVADDSLVLITAVAAEGVLEFKISEMSFQPSQLGERKFGSGQGPLFGRAGVWVRIHDVWVRIHDEEKNEVTIRWRFAEPGDDPFAPALIGSRLFTRLKHLPKPPGMSGESVEVESQN